MSSYMSLLFFTLAIIWFSTHAKDNKLIKNFKKDFQNFEENLFQELNQFSSFPDKDSEAISVQHKLEPVLFSRRRRSFPDNPGEQQAGDFSDKTHLDGIQNNPKDAFPDSSSNREQPKPPETNALISEQINKSSDPGKMAVPQSETVQKPEQSQNSVAGQQLGMNLPAETQGNILGQQQKQPLVKAESNVAVQEPIQSQNNVNGLQQPAQAQAQNNVNGLQQPAQAQNNVNGLQQPAQAQNNVNGLQQPAQAQNNVNGLQQPAQAQNNVNGLQQPAQAQNNINGLQQQAHAQNSIQAQSNGGLAPVSEQNSLNKPVLSPNGQPANDLNQVKNYVPTNQQGQFQIGQNSLPLNQQNSPVAKPIQGQQIIDNGGLSAETQNHRIDNGGLSADQQKPVLINGNDQSVDQSIADKHQLPTNKPNSPSEFGMNNNLHPAHITGNELNVKPPGDQPKVYITSQAVQPGQISVTPSKVDSSSRAPFFIISTLMNVQKEPEHSQEFGKQDDGWYYNQEIDDSLHQGVTESEKHAGKQMLMSAHHFDIPLGALAGAKMFNNDLWQKNHKQYLVNKKSETFEPMSMALFYSWIALATLAVLGIFTIFRHRHKVTGYVYDLRYWHNGGYVEEGRRLLHNAYA